MSNALNGADAMVRMLQAHGVRHVFGLCGDTSLPLYDSLLKLDHGITHILTRDERSATYMADAYARVSGRPGVCEGPSGGGATYILPGLVEARESSHALLAITSDVSVASYAKYPLTEVDQEALMRPLTKWNTVIRRADHIPRMVRAAFREMAALEGAARHWPGALETAVLAWVDAAKNDQTVANKPGFVRQALVDGWQLPAAGMDGRPGARGQLDDL